jgi:serine/threonine protein kinase
VCFGDNSYVVDVTMEPLSLIPVGSEEAMRYIEEGTRIEEHPLVRPELSERSCVTVPDLRERALLHERLGRGSISEVFRATVGGVACALKVISLARMTADQRRYVEREVQIMEMARHENIVRYLGHENIPDKEEMHIMMELFPESLTQLITKRKGLGHRSLALGEIKMLAIQVLSGIDYLHGRNIVHADLKSDNILVDFDAQGEFNRIKISDLGVCQVAESCDSQSVACHVGTTVYMAPEAMTRGEYSTAADVWSFGLLLVEMISLARPYASLTPSAAIMKIESGEAPEFPSPGCSKQAKILAAARRCLIRDPQSRPSAERLLVDFHRIQCNC